MNECGDCTACCEVLPIKELNKPKNTMCSDCTGSGCGIYEKRPQVCKDYQCIYTQSNMPEELRPDKSGVILEYLKDGTYQAALFKGTVYESDPIMKHIRSMEKKNNIRFKIVDAR